MLSTSIRVPYRLTIYIAPKWVARFREQNFHLCTAFGVSSSHSKERYNIIASSEEPTPLNTVSWVDTYEIAACKTGFEDGAYVFPNTVPVPIEVGQSYTLRHDWSSVTNNPPINLQTPGYHFHSETSACALLFKSIRNKSRPIYLSSLEGDIAPPGKHVLQPTGTIMVFFAKNGENQIAFDPKAISTAYFELEYATLEHHTTNVSYNDLGMFQLIDTAGTTAENVLPERLVRHLRDEEETL